MGNSESISKLTVINQDSRRLKVRVDSNRKITNCNFSVSGKGIKISEKHKTTMYYVVDTSDSFAFVAPGGQMDFIVEGDLCYITACYEDNTPLFINHGVPTKSVVTIKDNLPHVETKLEEDARRAILVQNHSNKEVRARVDCDEGICSIDYAIAAKGYEIQVSQSSTVYYQVNKQGYTTLKPNQETIFYINIPYIGPKRPILDESNLTCFVTLQYVNSEGEIHDICKNYRRRMDKYYGTNLTFNGTLYFTGPAFTVETDTRYGATFKNRRFRYLKSEYCVFGDKVHYGYMKKWEIIDKED